MNKQLRKTLMHILYMALALSLLIGLVTLFSNLVNRLTQEGIDSENASCIDYRFVSYNSVTGLCNVNENNAYDEIIFVVGNTENSSAPELSSDVRNILHDSIMNSPDIINGNIIAFSATSRVKQIPLQLSTIDDANIDDANDSIMNNIEQINVQLKVAPESSGAKYLEAIETAARNHKRSGDKALMVVIGSGLSDSGLLNFAKNDFLRMSNDDIVNMVDQIEVDGNLRENLLDGIEIKWTNLGEVIAPQAELSELEKNTLKNLYGEIFNRMGVMSFTDDNALEQKSIIDNPNNYKVITTSVEQKTPTIWTFSEKQLGFVAGKSELVDNAKAREVLFEVQMAAKSRSNSTITIIGYQASGNCTNDNPTGLGGRRAELIKEILVEELSVTNKIKTIDGGIPDGAECQNGIWDDNLAQLKRLVKISME